MEWKDHLCSTAGTVALAMHVIGWSRDEASGGSTLFSAPSLFLLFFSFLFSPFSFFFVASHIPKLIKDARVPRIIFSSLSGLSPFKHHEWTLHSSTKVNSNATQSRGENLMAAPPSPVRSPHPSQRPRLASSASKRTSQEAELI